MKAYKLFPPIVVILVSLACSQVTIGVTTPTSTVDPVVGIVQATLEAVYLEATAVKEGESALPTPILTMESPVWLTNEQIPTGPTLPEFLAGLVFYDTNGLWLVDQTGLSHLVSGMLVDVALSPDGTGLLYSSSMSEGEDIYYLNMATGIVAQLTDTPDIFERGYQWWSPRNNIIVFNFIPEDELGPWYGYLGAYDMTTSEYIILDDQYGSGSSFALSPDGQKIAYNQGDQPVIYTWDQGTETVEMSAFGLDFKSYSSPAWSPDGKQIAYHAAGGAVDELSGGSRSATVIIDLENNSAVTLHEFVSFGRRAEPEIAWSPDGQWLAVVNPGEFDPAGNPLALWVMRTDGTEEYHFGFSNGVRWSPDGQYLVFTEYPPVGTEEESLTKFVELGVWAPFTLESIQGINQWIGLP